MAARPADMLLAAADRCRAPRKPLTPQGAAMADDPYVLPYIAI